MPPRAHDLEAAGSLPAMAFAAVDTLDTDEIVNVLEWMAAYMPHALLTAIEGMRQAMGAPDGWDQGD